MTANSVFDGNADLIHHALGLTIGEHLKQKSTCASLSVRQVNREIIARLIGDLKDQVLSNWSGRIPSRANWRMERQISISLRNKSQEVVLERAIATLSERRALDGWYNQIPVASGLIDHKADKRAAIDLIKVQDRHVSLVELKWESDTPAFAAFEILQYGLAYLLCRDKQEVFGYQDKELLQAEQVSLQVLAPAEYYSPYNLGFLADGINKGLERLCLGQDDGLTMSFEFLKFPPDFKLPFLSGEDVLRHQSEPTNAVPNRCLIDAMNNFQPVW